MTTRFALPVLASAIVAVTVVAATGAQAQARTDSVDTAAAPVTKDATVYVANNNWLDIRVYAVANGRVHRLGNVTSFSTAEFKLPKQFVVAPLDVQLLAYPIGSRARAATPVLLLTPGAVIEWHVENNLNLSSVAVWGG